MDKDAGEKQQLVSMEASNVPTQVPLGPRATLDLSWLPETERKTLLTEYSRGLLDLSRKAQEYHLDIESLKRTLDGMASATKEMTGGGRVVINHTQTTSIGRTEVTMRSRSLSQRILDAFRRS